MIFTFRHFRLYLWN